MSQFVKRGLVRIKRAFSGRKGKKNVENKAEHQQRMYDIEQRMQQEKDKILLQRLF